MSKTDSTTRQSSLWLRLPLLLAGTLLLTTGCDHLVTVHGNGDITRDSRELAPFTHIDADGAVDINILYGSTQSVTVTTDANIQPILTTEVRGDNTLYISSTESYSSTEGVKIDITIPVIKGVQIDGSSDVVVASMPVELDTVDTFTLGIAGSGDILVQSMRARTIALEIEGSGDMLLENVSVNRLNAVIEGSGDLEVNGRCGHFDLDVEGSGDVEAVDLMATEADVRIAGSGEVDVWATDLLRATINGSGTIRYKGSPTIERSISGSGEIRPL